MNKTKNRRIYPVIKRIADVLLSLLAMLVLLPVFLAVAIAVKCDGGPVFYAQTRVGRGGKPFRVYKFRSMKPGAERLEDFLTPEELAEYRKEYKLVKDPRVSKVGGFLRKSSLDELPQMLNILKGDMSLVGPRPLLESELAGNYTKQQREQLLSVRPGLTGYWQAMSRNESSYLTGERQKQELYYIGRVSLGMDVKILCMTVKRVFSGKGAV
ncbi:MAG: sugar transferase [Ruminococcaceae bacterium]|nr:sugar transferase [Oscillospiraceae bacterium]